MKSKTIMIVEDEADIRNAIDIELSDQGYQCIQQENGDQALLYLEENTPPDLILLDIMMPGKVHGMKLLQVVKDDTRWKKIPVIMLSAKTESHLILEALRIGAADYIDKPYVPYDLVKRVDRLLGDKTEKGSIRSFRELHVCVMKLAVNLWEMELNQKKCELAEASGSWSVHTDKRGVSRSKTLERYLHHETLPENPNTVKVIQAAEFVLKKAEEQGVEHSKELRQELEHLKQQYLAQFN